MKRRRTEELEFVVIALGRSQAIWLAAVGLATKQLPSDVIGTVVEAAMIRDAAALLRRHCGGRGEAL